MSLAIGSVESPIGNVLVGMSPRGLALVSFGDEIAPEEMERLGRLYEGVVEDPGKTGRACRQIEEYFAGRRRRFALDLDLRAVTPFQRAVLRECASVEFGKITTYGELARAVGSPRAARAVGGALGRNPVGIVVPCHRVLAGDGSIGGFTGGLAIKRFLLDHEGIAVRSSGGGESQARRP
ncbi:MAG: methylated-DNA--[protein]-cysteine S-methyltransferase [Actinomycetota bacterium]